ncbi:hypothetical protein H663_016185 [Limnohabitans planktonicus II-D5]|jgi:hypothetical protein|uniref:Toxin CptA n=1 Tax=Limnohabitans planktonicus II-D5 TaxID=1293045 RepID=A0A2T7UAJ2_9BURK|nr:hypothetical protein H663_016185 [Limnohabitans planktonicus II-D5]
MHNAPPVVYPVGRFVWSWGLGLLWAFGGALGLSQWQLASSVTLITVISAWLVWSLCLMLAALCWRRERLNSGQLVWSGEQWLWRDVKGVETAQALKPLLDVGDAMVVCIRPSGATFGQASHMVWLHRQSMPHDWHGFRCAVYSRPPLPHPPAQFVQGL